MLYGLKVYSTDIYTKISTEYLGYRMWKRSKEMNSDNVVSNFE